ncbi:MAG: hypothetical protein COW32_10045 [Candidatus Aquicultor secundus]|uniref:hypothetical protein n=1 Tax=Candidatus Aquicultor secundus TaxID=1973895 RepID=UPI0009169844|nr:hypothetical protein [Candidatus Aquicultor secundus]OIO88010.1 MAG: hypothetical protein AUK32_02425 [Candidatus Aquicultor secundus]PIW21420.1 MAG: hypothetical protein COW32_10045 [Candidatus Aquicultor secundus]PIX51509.1 MAG: hypothetical protein COZ51_09315 [Candidatus Aquicultor secundus]
MPTAKRRVQEIIESQPDDATYDELIRELAFERMIERGIKDSRKERVISNEEMRHRIKAWQK